MHRFRLKEFHQRATDALSGVPARDEEVVNVPGALDIRVANRPAFNLCYEWVDSPNAIHPKVAIKVCWRPCVDLFFGVIATGNEMNRGVIDLEKSFLFAKIEAADTHGTRFLRPNVEGNRPADEMRTEDQSMCRRVRLTVRLGGRDLQVFRRKTSVLSNPGKHLRSDLIGVMERKHEIGPAVTTEGAMGTRLALDLPPDPKQRR